MTATLPQALEPLRHSARWVSWRREKVGDRITKVPYTSHGRRAKADDAATWRTFDQLDHNNGFDGPGVVLGDELQGVDLDVCIDADGVLEPWAAEVVERLDSYTEVSPSGRGLKVFFYGPPGPSAKVTFGAPVDIGEDKPKTRELAYFTAARYFTVTGRLWRERAVRRINDDDAQWLRAKVENLRTLERARKDAGKAKSGKPAGDAPKFTRGSLPDDLMRLIAEGVPEGERSEQFFHAVRWCADCGLTADQITNLIDAHPDGIGAKYAGRVGVEVERCLRGYVPNTGKPTADKPNVGGSSVHRESSAGGVTLEDFHAYMPTHQYLFVPTRELWPGSSVNARVEWPEIGGKRVKPTDVLDASRAIEQMVWHPAEPQIVKDRVMQVSGWVRHPGASVFNMYRPSAPPAGDASQAAKWIEHVHRVYPDDAKHLIAWFAFKVQHPGDKVNHALVLGGAQGIGKDTMLEPVKAAIGPWNWADVSPGVMLGRFNGYVRSVIVRVNEARDLGDTNRFAFYDHMKTLTAAPPDVLRVDEKHLRETYSANVCGVVYTTNHSTDGLYLPADDRRHYVAWSPLTRQAFDADYWADLWTWYANGGIGHVCDYLRTLDIGDFNPKAPPRQTAAFWTVVAASESPESGELRDILDDIGNPAVVTLSRLILQAEHRRQFGLADELKDRKSRRSVPHKLERAGYLPVRNPNADDGLFKIGGRRQTVYGKDTLTEAQRISEARKLAA